MTLIQLLNHYLYFVVQILSSDLFKLWFFGNIAFVAIIGCVYIIRYLISLRR